MKPAHRIALVILLTFSMLSSFAQTKVARPLVNPQFFFSKDASYQKRVTSGDTLTLIGEHAGKTGMIVKFDHKYSTEVDLEFEFQIYNDKTPPAEIGEGLCVILFNNLGAYHRGEDPPSGASRGYIPNGGGLCVHFQMNPTREVQIRDGSGKVLASAPAEDIITQNTKWAKVRITAKNNTVNVILSSKPVLVTKFTFQKDEYRYVAFGAGTTDTSTAAHYLRNVLVYANPDPVYPYLAPQQILAWDRLGPSGSDDEKRKVLPFLPYDRDPSYPPMEDVATHLKNMFMIDLNKDGKLDAIYRTEGKPGDRTFNYGIDFFINSGDEFTRIFSHGLDFFDVEFSPVNGNLKRLITEVRHNVNLRYLKITDFAWDGPSNDFFGFSYNDVGVQFPSNTVLPKTLFEKPKYFETLNPIYTLRTAPLIDSVYKQRLELHGNVLGYIAKGTRGRALAQATDDAGRVWWFVEIYPGYKFYTSVYKWGGNGLQFASDYNAGWMSSRYVKEL